MIHLLAMSAFAADPIGDLPAIAADAWRPTGGDQFGGTDARRAVGQQVGMTVSVAHKPLVWVPPVDAPVAVVRDVVTWHARAAWGYGPVVLEGTLPVIVLATSDVRDPIGMRVGDPGLGARLVLFDGTTGHGGLAAVARATLPLGAYEHQLGLHGPSGGFGATVEAPEGFPFGISAEALLWLRPTIDFNGASLGETWTGRVGLTTGAGTAADLSLDLLVGGPLSDTRVDAVPVEAMFGVHAGPATRRVHIGLGGGLRGAVGSPSVRLVVGVDTTGGGRSQLDIDRKIPSRTERHPR